MTTTTNQLKLTVFIASALISAALFFNPVEAIAKPLQFEDLLQEALKNNPELNAYRYKAAAARHKAYAQSSLPDPMLMVGYKNMGFRHYSYGDAESEWMFSVSQMFPFFGKLSSKRNMLLKESEVMGFAGRNALLKTLLKVKETYYDYYGAVKTIELMRDKFKLYSQVEEIMLARSKSAQVSQSDVVMAQTEKAMLQEKLLMQEQRRDTLLIMLQNFTGLEGELEVSLPAELQKTELKEELPLLMTKARSNHPEAAMIKAMNEAIAYNLDMNRLEYLPDFTLGANYYKRARPYEDMWAVTLSFNLPVFFYAKQSEAVSQSDKELAASRKELQAALLMLDASVKESFLMHKTSEKLLELYETNLLAKARNDFSFALSGYATGKLELSMVLGRLKTLNDYESARLNALVDHEKQVAKLLSLTEKTENPKDISHEK